MLPETSNANDLDRGRFTFRPLADADRASYGCMLHSAFNAWYWQHGWGRDYFTCTPDEAGVFYDIYNDLSPGCSIAGFDQQTGAMVGACFFHPREHHVSLGIMAVHPDYFGQGLGRLMVDHIVDFTEENGFKTLRLVSSAMNMDSFSLYNRSGLVPRVSYHDMILSVPEDGMTTTAPEQDRVRAATLEDVDAMAAIELECNGVSRSIDYKYAIENARGFLDAVVLEKSDGSLEGFAISVDCPALKMIGPCVAHNENGILALVGQQLGRFAGSTPVFLVPMEKRQMVETLYDWGARNVETHLYQVRGEHAPFKGVNMPSFLPETG